MTQHIRELSKGLSNQEAEQRLRLRRQTEKMPSEWHTTLSLFFRQFKNPLVLLLVAAVILAALLGDLTNSAIILCILLMTGFLGFWQEYKAGNAVERLKAMVKSVVWVCREGEWKQIPQSEVVEEDYIRLSAGDIIPGDGRLIASNNLYVDEAALTGESFPVEKSTAESLEENNSDRGKLLQGTNVVSGTAEAIVTRVGADTEMGKIALDLQSGETPTAFELGISNFGYLLIRLTLLLAFGILIFNILLGRPAVESSFFALALAVGMAPELLPAIMVTTLSAGALRMAQRKVVVKKLSSIQNLGSIDILCSDKTGTLTEGVVRVHATLDWSGQPSEKVRQFAYLNAYFESGFSNPVDEALRNLSGLSTTGFSKMDEVPYDFIRKRLSVVVAHEGKKWMITKGALSNILEVCHAVENAIPFSIAAPEIQRLAGEFGSNGYRILGLACKEVTNDPEISRESEQGMTFMGFILLYDPPKPDVHTTLAMLEKSGVHLKIISGDSEYTVRHTAESIGMRSIKILTGKQLQQISDDALPAMVIRTSLFAEVEPHQKERIIRAFRAKGKVVGYLGDGINDAPALKAADVGISVDSGVDVAKAAADIVLLDKNLDVLLDGILEGRRTFSNTLKYIFITTSANFGNMFSLAGASLLIPYLPLLPKQVLLLNFLSDVPALFIASDKVDEEMLKRPQRWNIALIRRFMYVFGAQSSLFDFLTFGVLLFVFRVGESTFQTVWFTESLLTEVIVLLVIRTKRRAWQSLPSYWLLWTSLGVAGIALVISYLPFSALMGFSSLNVRLLVVVACIAIIYGLLSEYVKDWFWRTLSHEKR